MPVATVLDEEIDRARDQIYRRGVLGRVNGLPCLAYCCAHYSELDAKDGFISHAPGADRWLTTNMRSARVGFAWPVHGWAQMKAQPTLISSAPDLEMADRFRLDQPAVIKGRDPFSSA